MDKVLNLVEEKVTVQGTVTIALVFTTCYLAIAGRPVPESVVGASCLALGYYFGNETKRRLARELKEQG